MLMNVAVSVVEQLKGKTLCELKAEDSDDADEKNKTEKEFFTFKCSMLPNANLIELLSRNKSIFIENEQLSSELFCFLLELPPELECGFQPA
jgi:hypothetical protein